MLRNPDLDALAEKFEEGRRKSMPLLMLLGRACGRLAGTPDMDELARQGLALLGSNDVNASDEQREGAGRPDAWQVKIPVDRNRLKDWHRAFQSAFPTAASLRDMVTSSTGLQAPQGQWTADTLPASIESLFDWASSKGQLDTLVSAAVAYNPGNPALRAIAGSHQASAGPDQAAVRDEFSRRFRDLSSLERFSLLQSIYRRIPVPAFYQDFARIVKAGYVRQILTTNIDSLLEQALESQGLARDVDFEVVVLGTPSSRDALSALEQQDAPERQLIIKLHGDITQGEFGLSQDEIDHAVRAAKRYIKDELDADLVMVGYEAESGPLNEWLARARSGFWWVDEEPSRIPMDPTHVRWVRLGVSDFFATLAPQLFTLRTTSVRTRELWLAGALAPPDAAVGAAELSEPEALRREIGRLKSEVAALSLATAASTTPVQRQEQAAERLRRIRELEDRLRALPDVQRDLLELLARIEQGVADVDDAAPVDAETRAYLLSQLAAVRSQFGAAAPNPHVVSAALGAVLVVADRLGPTVLNPQDVRALAGFSPSTLVRV
jgi:phosphoglycolate phosphatase-like HAD superfamily hydrolase